ncbi:MAG: outer membrane protein assembly factor BamE [Rhodospirillales bacterium]|nr:outer membrane protein assembly factor BamE [Rhodospirillales bacterium]
MRHLIVAATILLATLSACVQTYDAREVASSGNRQIFDDKVLSGIVENKSTKNDVRALLGSPTNIAFPSKDTESWVYHATIAYSRPLTVGPGVYAGGGGDTTMRTLTILFDDGGTVRKVGVGETKASTGGAR